MHFPENSRQCSGVYNSAIGAYYSPTGVDNSPTGVYNSPSSVDNSPLVFTTAPGRPVCREREREREREGETCALSIRHAYVERNIQKIKSTKQIDGFCKSLFARTLSLFLSLSHSLSLSLSLFSQYINLQNARNFLQISFCTNTHTHTHTHSHTGEQELYVENASRLNPRN